MNKKLLIKYNLKDNRLFLKEQTYVYILYYSNKSKLKFP
jgi:hypothetical protein